MHTNINIYRLLALVTNLFLEFSLFYYYIINNDIGCFKIKDISMHMDKILCPIAHRINLKIIMKVEIPNNFFNTCKQLLH